MSPNEALLLFSGRGMAVSLDDEPDVLQGHVDRLAASADGALAGAESLAAKDWLHYQAEIIASIAAARVLVQLARAASLRAAGGAA